jgi:hypothetical protein
MVREVVVAATVLLLYAGSGVAAVDPVIIPECAVQAEGAETDADGDGLSDRCEYALAWTFAPLLFVRAGGCNWITESDPPRLGGGYLHAVSPAAGGIRVAYLPAYFVDCGWRDRRCLLPFVNCAPHEGDSEIIVVELAPAVDSGAWTVSGVFLSAHCFGRGSRACRWYRGEALDRFRWHGAAPVIWVAEGRNANYPSWQACNAGHRTMDTCARHDTSYRFPVWFGGNIGSRTVPIGSHGCLRGGDLPSGGADPAHIECLWDPGAAFRGWQSAGRGVTPYERYLREVAGF